MAYVQIQIPNGVPYYDTETDTTKTDGLRWQIMEDTVTKVFAINPDQPANKIWNAPGSLPYPYIKGGFPAAMAAYVCWLLNNRPV